MSSGGKACFLCRIPAPAVLSALGAAVAIGAVLVWRAGVDEGRISQCEQGISGTRITVAEMSYIKDVVERIETKLDNHIATARETNR